MTDFTAGKLGDAAAAGRKPLFSEDYKRVVLAVLVAAYTFNFIDRTIISTIGQAIKVDLGLTDGQLGLLGGFSFALLYTLLGIPIARLAERWNRVSIIGISLVVWSGFTALCGAASNFAMLLAFRVGVGVGEAGCSPPAHSLISDYFEPRKRASALATYSFGIPLGTMIGAAAGGWLADTVGWRWTLVIVGLPGILLALIVKMTIKEPARGHADTEAALFAGETPRPSPAPPPLSIGSEVKELLSVSKTLFASWPVLNVVLGVTIASFGSYGTGQFVPPYFIRQFGLSLTEVGLITGLIGGFSAGVGTLLGGFLTDFLGKRSKAWYALVPALGLLIATPIYILAYLQDDWRIAAAILLIPGIFHYTYLGPTFGIVQNVVETRRRATATAILFFFLNFIALGFGPPFVGYLIDFFAQSQFAANVIATDATNFASQCPGGAAPDGAPAALADACRTTLNAATRQGIIVGLCFYAWAGVHYLIASFGIAKVLARKAAEMGSN